MRRAGFTLIEMMAVVFILAAISAVAVPAVASMMKSARMHSYLNDVEKICEQARQEAVRSGQTVSLTSESEGSFQFTQGSTDLQQDEENPNTVDAVEGVTVQRLTVGDQEQGTGEWAVHFYSDGTSDRGSIEFSSAGEEWFVTIDKRGQTRLDRGDAPANTDDSWQAGDYVQRN